MLDVQHLFSLYRLPIRGVIHVGAHLGGEVPLYKRMGFRPILLVEANPAVFAELSRRVTTSEDLMIEPCAVVDRDGPVNFHVTSFDQSSSILPLAKHREYHPSIVPAETITVSGKTLDSILSDRRLDPSSFNFLSMDIQGAELLALKGAGSLLRYLDAINAEINIEELYAGCARIEELDAFLGEAGFVRTATVCAIHPSWGDGFYVRRHYRQT